SLAAREIGFVELVGFSRRRVPRIGAKDPRRIGRVLEGRFSHCVSTKPRGAPRSQPLCCGAAGARAKTAQPRLPPKTKTDAHSSSSRRRYVPFRNETTGAQSACQGGKARLSGSSNAHPKQASGHRRSDGDRGLRDAGPGRKLSASAAEQWRWLPARL